MNEEDINHIFTIIENDVALKQRLSNIMLSQCNVLSFSPFQDDQNLLKALEKSGENFRKLLNEP